MLAQANSGREPDEVDVRLLFLLFRECWWRGEPLPLESLARERLDLERRECVRRCSPDLPRPDRLFGFRSLSRWRRLFRLSRQCESVSRCLSVPRRSVSRLSGSRFSVSFRPPVRVSGEIASLLAPNYLGLEDPKISLYLAAKALCSSVRLALSRWVLKSGMYFPVATSHII